MRVHHAQELRELVGLHVSIVCTGADSVSGATGLLIGVTQTTHGVYADFADGVSLPVHSQKAVSVDGARDPDEQDVTLFRRCVSENYYPNLPMTDRLTRLLEAS